MESILIILTGSLGDICRGFCLLSPIKKRYPGCKITWLTDQRWTPLVQSHPLIDEVLVFNRSRKARGIVECIKMLRKRDFECVLDLQRILKSGIFSWATGSSKRIGFHRRDSKELNWIFQTKSIRPVGQGVSKVVHYLQFLSALGISDQSEVDFGLLKGQFKGDLPTDFPDRSAEGEPGGGRDRAGQNRAGQNRVIHIGVVMGSSWSSKDWPLQGIQRLVGGLLELHGDIVVHLLGDASRQAMANALKDHFYNENIHQRDTDSHRAIRSLSIVSSQDSINSAQRAGRICNWVGKTGLCELAAIIERCSMVIGPDSGPGHLAASLGVPYLGLFGPTDPERVAAWGSKHLALKSELGCAPCGKRECPGLDNLCMRTISPERVIRAVGESLGF